MASIVETLEAPLLRVPFDGLKRAAKDRKALIDDAAALVATLKPPSGTASTTPAPTTPAAPDPSGDTEMADASAAEATPATTPAPSTRGTPAPEPSAPSPRPTPGPAITLTTTREESLEKLRQLLSQLQGVKRKLADVSRTEADDSQRCRARLEHLAAVRPAQEPGGLIPWTRQRLDVILVDQLLRSGYYDTASKLASSGRISLLTDAHIFEGARRILAALLEHHDVSPALAWCGENRSRLAKAKSPLEFKLHVQQFIERVRRDDRAAAIAYARANLAPWAGTYMAELQRAVATLAFSPRSRTTVYKALFEESQWRSLADLFLRDLYRLNSLTPESLLNVHLQAGLSALKTPASGEPGGSREDPLRLPAFQRLAAGLPYSKHMHSKLVCAVTKEIMSDSNPPMVLPNGMVYSQRGIEVLITQAAQQQKQHQQAGSAGAAQGPQGQAAGVQPGGWGVCPATGLMFRREELRRAFIA